MAENETNLSSDAWYAFDGPENDVVLSTRVRLARNLANFPFPSKFKDDDAFRVQTLVFDSFSHCEEPDKYQGVVASELDELGALILEERGVLDANSAKENGSGIIVRTDGKVSCAINTADHVRLSAFVPGLDGNGAFSLCAKVDDELHAICRRLRHRLSHFFNRGLRKRHESLVPRAFALAFVFGKAFGFVQLIEPKRNRCE